MIMLGDDRVIVGMKFVNTCKSLKTMAGGKCSKASLTISTTTIIIIILLVCLSCPLDSGLQRDMFSGLCFSPVPSPEPSQQGDLLHVCVRTNLRRVKGTDLL